MKRTTIEVCCGSTQDVFNAKAGGADRVELNSGLFFGGLTPSIGSLLEAQRAGIPIMAMVRPRESGFCYSETEFDTMLRDAQLFCEHGADGIVFGFLHEDCSLDVERCRAMLAVIGQRESVFHRAIDVVGERWREVIDALCELHVTRILTSGQRAAALDGMQTIRAMREYAAGRIEILPCGNIREHNINEILSFTGCTQAHTSGSSAYSDRTVLAVPEIHFTATELPAQECYRLVNAEAIAGIVNIAL